jgi:hypothetical protein
MSYRYPSLYSSSSLLSAPVNSSEFHLEKYYYYYCKCIRYVSFRITPFEKEILVDVNAAKSRSFLFSKNKHGTIPTTTTTTTTTTNVGGSQIPYTTFIDV